MTNSKKSPEEENRKMTPEELDEHNKRQDLVNHNQLESCLPESNQLENSSLGNQQAPNQAPANPYNYYYEPIKLLLSSYLIFYGFTQLLFTTNFRYDADEEDIEENEKISDEYYEKYERVEQCPNHYDFLTISEVLEGTWFVSSSYLRIGSTKLLDFGIGAVFGSAAGTKAACIIDGVSEAVQQIGDKIIIEDLIKKELQKMLHHQEFHSIHPNIDNYGIVFYQFNAFLVDYIRLFLLGALKTGIPFTGIKTISDEWAYAKFNTALNSLTLTIIETLPLLIRVFTHNILYPVSDTVFDGLRQVYPERHPEHIPHKEEITTSTKIADTIEDIQEEIGDTIEEIQEDIGEVVTEIQDNVIEAAQDIREDLVNIANQIEQLVVDAANDVENISENIITELVEVFYPSNDQNINNHESNSTTNDSTITEPVRKKAICQKVSGFLKWLFWMKSTKCKETDNTILHSNHEESDITQMNNNVVAQTDNHIQNTNISSNNQTSQQEHENNLDHVGLTSLVFSPLTYEI